MDLRHFKKRIGLVLPLFSRTIKRDIFQMIPKMTREEREISVMIKNLLNNAENRVIYSTKSKSIRIQTRDKKYIISLTSNSIRINFVLIELNERIGNLLVDRVIDRMESDIDDMDNNVIEDRKKFLNDMNGIFIRGNTEFSKRSELVKNSSSKNIETTLSRILGDSINE